MYVLGGKWGANLHLCREHCPQRTNGEPATCRDAGKGRDIAGELLAVVVLNCSAKVHCAGSRLAD